MNIEKTGFFHRSLDSKLMILGNSVIAAFTAFIFVQSVLAAYQAGTMPAPLLFVTSMLGLISVMELRLIYLEIKEGK